jgi:hypothetical protein
MTTRHRLIIACLCGIILAQWVPATPIGMPWPSIGVPVGPKRVLIVRETLNSDLNGVMVSLRADPYIAAKGHTLDVLDPDAKDKDGKPSPIVAEFKARNVAPPALMIAVPGGKILYCESLPKPPTAAGIVATIKANGGGE